MVSVGVHKKGEVSLYDLLKKIKAHPEAYKAGAIGCFIGIVRGVGADGSKVEKLEYDTEKELAEKELRKIAEEIADRPEIIDVSIHHNVDIVKTGEDILYVLVLGKHRKEAFWGVQRAVDELKKRAPIWKKEHTVKGSRWISASH